MDIEILQMSLEKFNSKILNEKNPVIIHDNIENVMNFINTFIYYNEIKEVSIVDYYRTIDTRFVLIHHLNDKPLDVLIIPPNNKLDLQNTADEFKINIKLYTGNILILPYKTIYKVLNAEKIKIYELNDYIFKYL
jgi:hypothetical protein